MMDRFSCVNRVKNNGYFGILDSNSEDDTIWIDCAEKFLDIIINALNASLR